jgi:hypothetical protein
MEPVDRSLVLEMRLSGVGPRQVLEFMGGSKLS